MDTSATPAVRGRRWLAANNTTAKGRSKMELLTIREVAERLRVSEQRAYELARQEVIPVVRIGRQVRVDAARLVDWIAGGGSTPRGSTR